MGHRLHVAKTYKVEYGVSAFNQQIDAVESLLLDFSNSIYIGEYSGDIEIDRDELLQIATKVQSMDENEFAKYGFDNAFDQEYVASMLRRFALESDQDDTFVHLFWF